MRRCYGGSASAAASKAAASYGDILGDAELRAAYAEHVSAIYRAPVRAGMRRHHRRLQPGLPRRDPGAREGRRRGDAPDALVLQPQDGARHARHRGACPSPAARRPASCPTRRTQRACSTDRVRAIVLVTPEQPDRRRLCARHHPRVREALRGAWHRAHPRRDLPRLHRLPTSHAAQAVRRDATGRIQLIQLYSFSKAYCIPGHRVGAIVADAEPARRGRQDPRYAADLRAARAPARAPLGDSGARRVARPEPRGDASRAQRPSRCAIAELDGWTIRSIGAYFAYVEHPLRWRAAAPMSAPGSRPSAASSAFPAPISAQPAGFLARRFRQCRRRGIGRVSERLGAT